MSSNDAKMYLSKRNVPGLFECLMTGLMFHRPTDHIQYLIDCLEKVKAKGQDELRWNMFIEMQRAKTPLPPITPTNGRRPVSRERSMTPKEERAVTPPRTATPLPPIGDKGMPDVPVIFLMGGPGSGKSTQAEMLLQKYPGWVSISIGDLLRSEIANKGEADQKWGMVKDLMSKGELVPEEVVQSLLIVSMKKSPKAQGFIIQGFPRDMEQAKEYDKLVGRVDAVFLLDCEEETLSQQLLERGKDTGRVDNNVNTIAKRIQAYKDKTLPVLKHYDDMEKLFILEGEKPKEEIAEDMALLFETVVGGKGKLSPAPPAEPKPERKKSPRSGRSSPKKVSSPEPSAPPLSEAEESGPLPSHLLPPEVKVKDEGRKPDLPQAPIIFFAGGPASGKGTQCKKLLSRYEKAVHLSMGDIIRTKITTEGSADMKWDMVTDLLRKGELAPEEVTVELLIDNLKQHPDAHFFIIEGFPRNLEQLEDFNKHIGGMSYTILLDCEEECLHYRLSKRGKESERIDDNLVAIGKKLTFFKNTTLPILKTIEDDGKLVVIPGDRDEDEIYFDLCKIFDFSIYNKLPEIG
ncbi:hypothetical protein BaRGS_00034680, partial [Batillaria attramentaria]